MGEKRKSAAENPAKKKAKIAPTGHSEEKQTRGKVRGKRKSAAGIPAKKKAKIAPTGHSEEKQTRGKVGGKRKSAAGIPAKKKAKIAPTGHSEEKLKKRGARSEEAVIPVDEEEKSFPRGGQQKLTPLEKAIIKTQAEQDVLFGENEDSEEEMKKEEKPAKKKTKPTGGKQKAKKLDVLSLKRVVPGMLLLGAVLEVRKYDAVISLPFNMKGTVAISDVSDHVTKMVEEEAKRMDEDEKEEEEEEEEESLDVPTMKRLLVVGQLMPCYVQNVTGPRINLSVNPRLINSHLSPKDIKAKLVLSGVIKSIEDHGYIVDFATGDKTGFLLKKNAAEFVKNQMKGKSLCLEQVVQCLVLDGANARTIPVTINPSKVCDSVVPSDHKMGIKSLLPGLLVTATVKEVAFNGILMSFLDGFSGVVSPQHLTTPGDEEALEKFQMKKKCKARLLWVDVSVKFIGLTLQRELVEGRSFKFEGLEIGDCFEEATVIQVQFTSSLYLELGKGIIGFVPAWMITDEKPATGNTTVTAIKDRKKYRKGTVHDSRIVQFNSVDGVAIVSLQESVLERTYMKYSDISIGDVVDGVVERIGSFGLIISVNEGIHGICPKRYVSDVKTIVTKPGKKYKQGSKVRCCVVNVDPSKKRLMLACKKSFVRCSKEIPAEYALAEPGGVYNGVITSIRPYGCIVHFLGHVRGLVRKPELSSTKFISDLSLVFWEGQPVECRVMECDVDNFKLLLSFRLDPSVGVISDEDALRKGSFVEGEVTGISSDGISLKYLPSGETFFLPTLHLSDDDHSCPHLLAQHQNNLEKALKRGEPYVIPDLRVLHGKQRSGPALGTLKKHVQDHVREKGSITDSKVTVPNRGVNRELKTRPLSDPIPSINGGDISDSDAVDDDDDDEASGKENGIGEEDDTSDLTLRPTLTTTRGFQWETDSHHRTAREVSPSNSESEDDEDLDDVEVTSKKTRRQKKAAKKSEEIELFQKERSLLDLEGKEAESAEDFDRLLLATPNSSSLWVQYMAFYLHTAEVDRARGVAQRALKTISFREEHEKLNVWVGWMNLENLYGSQDSLLKVFETSLQQNEPLEVYKRLVAIYEQSDKTDLAGQLYQTMTRKFGGIQWVWSQYATFLMKLGKQGQARSLLQKALRKIVSKQEHVSMISKFSQLEFKYGEPERGRTMFESLLSTYPRRIDIWSVYIDMVIKTGDYQKVRNIFEQAIHLKISAKKMKALFKRYLEFEKQHGNQARMDAVIEKARTFVESNRSQTD